MRTTWAALWALGCGVGATLDAERGPAGTSMSEAMPGDEGASDPSSGGDGEPPGPGGGAEGTADTSSPADTSVPADTDVDLDTDTDAGPAPARCAGRTVGTAVGECAPDFTLRDAAGAEVSLYGEAGRVTVIDFSTMWCPHCRNLAPVLETLHTTHAADGLSVITVIHEDNSSQPPDAADLRAWAAAYGVTHTLLADPGAKVEAVFGGFYQPNVLVLDADLVVRWRNTGGSAAGAVTAAVEAVLDGRAP